MPVYNAPVDDVMFLLKDVFHIERHNNVAGFGDATPDVVEAADRIYQQLLDAKIEVLYDDRNERAGVKFNDADLLGIPLRLTVGGKGLKNGVIEAKVRRTGAASEIALANLLNGVQALLNDEWQALQATLTEEELL